MTAPNCQIPQDLPILPHTLTREQIYSGEQLTNEAARENRKVLAKFILENQDRFDMRQWHSVLTVNGNKRIHAEMLVHAKPEYRHSCGTAHCIAGWAETLVENRDDIFNMWQRGEECHANIGAALLGLNSVDQNIFGLSNDSALEVLKHWAKGKEYHI